VHPVFASVVLLIFFADWLSPTMHLEADQLGEALFLHGTAHANTRDSP
jgi:hypothetical protein